MEIEKNNAINAVTEEIEKLRSLSEQYRRWWQEELNKTNALNSEVERLEAELAKAKTEITALEAELSEVQTEHAEAVGEVSGLKFAIRCREHVSGVMFE